MDCLNLSASAAVKVSAIPNGENVAQKVVKMFKASAKKTTLLKCCIKEDVSSEEEKKRCLVGLCQTRFVDRHVSIPHIGGGSGEALPLPPLFSGGGQFTRLFLQQYLCKM